MTQRWLTYGDFRDRSGEVLDVRREDGGAVSLVQVDAVEGSQAGGLGPEAQERRQFSVLFRGPADAVLPQGTYTVVHGDLGELALFLVPLGPDGDGMRYEAAFA